MSSPKEEKIVLLSPDDVIPGDFNTTMWRWCLRNNWSYVPDPLGGEAWVDPRCAAAHCAPHVEYKTAKNALLKGVTRYPGGNVRISEVMRLRGDDPTDEC